MAAQRSREWSWDRSAQAMWPNKCSRLVVIVEMTGSWLVHSKWKRKIGGGSHLTEVDLENVCKIMLCVCEGVRVLSIRPLHVSPTCKKNTNHLAPVI